MTKKDLYGYLIHFNPFRNEWAAIPRGKERTYFNGETVEEDGIIRANCITSLMLNFGGI